MVKKIKKGTGDEPGQKKIFGDPEYSADEDIYSKEKKLGIRDSDEDDKLSEGLDVPGAELDNADEEIGEEDEENNYYSLGGDDHNDLEDDNGE
jgi:hypothetical protein